jgi:hypothetical protein
MKRINGFYWVLFSEYSKWEVWKYNNKRWYRPGFLNAYTDDKIYAIKETIIKHE